MKFIKAKEAEVMGGRDELQRWIAGETQGQIAEMATRVNQYQAQVMKSRMIVTLRCLTGYSRFGQRRPRYPAATP